MSINFPTSLDSLSNPSAGDLLENATTVLDHDQQHSNANDAIEALEAKVGANSSAVTTSHDYKLGEVTGTDKAVGKTATQTLTNKTLTSPAINLSSNATGDIYYRDSGGTFQRLPIGTSTQILQVSTNGIPEWTTNASAVGQNYFTATAEEDITIGQPVGVSNFKDNYVSRAYRFKSSTAHNITTSLFSGTNNSKYCAIGGDKYVMLNYTSAGSDTLFAQVGSIDRNTMTQTLGTAQTVATAFTPSGTGLSNTAICKLDTDKFVVFYLLDASTTVIKYRVGDVSGTTITFGTETTFATAGSTVATSTSWGADFISTNKGVMYFKAPTTTNSKIFAFTNSGTTLTVGTGVTPGANSQTDTASYIKTIATDKFVLVTPTTSTSIYAQVCTLSGTTITAGTEVSITTTTINGTESSIQVVSPSSNVFVIRIRGSSNNIPGLVACTVSGTVPTQGTYIEVSAGASQYGLIGGLYASSSSVLYVTGDNSASVINKVTLSGTTLTDAGRVGSYSSDIASEGTIAMDNGYFICVQASSTTIDAWIYGMSNNFIGIAQGTVSRGATLTILCGGVDSNQSSLVAGGSYLVSSGTLTLINNQTTINSLDDLYIVKAISSTQIVI